MTFLQYEYLLYKRLQYHVWKSRHLLFYSSRYLPISTRRQRKNLFDLRVKLPLVTCCKHKVYKHTEPYFWWKIKHMLSIMPSLNLRYKLKFFFEFNQSSIELYAFVNETCNIFPFKRYSSAIRSHVGVNGVKFFPYR